MKVHKNGSEALIHFYGDDLWRSKIQKGASLNLHFICKSVLLKLDHVDFRY
jgi:hypothetical protein